MEIYESWRWGGFAKKYRLMMGILAVFVILSFILPNPGFFEGAELFFGAITFLFAIVAGFSIAAAWGEYSSMRAAAAKEGSNMITLISLIKQFNKKIQNSIFSLMDRYLIAAFIVPYEEYHKTDSYFNKISKFLKEKINPKGAKQNDLFNEIADTLASWSIAREEQGLLGSRKLPRSLWMVLFVLSSLVIFNLYYIKVDNIFSYIVTPLLSFSVILILLVIRDLDNYSFGEGVLGLELFNKIIKLIGRSPFHWSYYTKQFGIKFPKGVKARTEIPKEYFSEY